MNRKYFLAALIGIISLSLNAQDNMLANRTGQSYISIYIGDTLLRVVNNQTTIIPNFETNQLKVKLNPQTFITGVDSLDQRINGLLDHITFDGVMRLEFYAPEKNRVEKFTIEGQLTLGDDQYYQMADGVLVAQQTTVNIYGSIKIHFDLETEVLNLPQEYDWVGGNACVEITQVLSGR